jgi:regulatory protein
MAKRFDKSPPPPPPEGSVITALAPASDERLVAVKIGRRTWAKIRKDDVEALGLHAGQPATPKLLDDLHQAAIRARGQKYAVNALSARGMSARTLEIKLKRKGVSETSARRITQDLSAKGVLDEAAYARAVAESELSRKPAGKSLLIRKLRQRGVTDANAKTAVERVLETTGHDPRQAALELARKKLRLLSRVSDPAAVRRRLYGQLARRGFDADTCRWAMAQVLKDTAADD